MRHRALRGGKVRLDGGPEGWIGRHWKGHRFRDEQKLQSCLDGGLARESAVVDAPPFFFQNDHVRALFRIIDPMTEECFSCSDSDFYAGGGEPEDLWLRVYVIRKKPRYLEPETEGASLQFPPRARLFPVSSNCTYVAESLAQPACRRRRVPCVITDKGVLQPNSGHPGARGSRHVGSARRDGRWDALDHLTGPFMTINDCKGPLCSAWIRCGSSARRRNHKDCRVIP